MMRVNIGDTRLFFDVEGASLVPDGPVMRERPTVVFLHGGPGADHSVFKPTVSPLADCAQLIYLDHRGQGRSDPSGPEHWNLKTSSQTERRPRPAGCTPSSTRRRSAPRRTSRGSGAPAQAWRGDPLSARRGVDAAPGKLSGRLGEIEDLLAASPLERFAALYDERSATPRFAGALRRWNPPPSDRYWTETVPPLSRSLPAVHTTGHYDVAVEGTIAAYQAWSRR
jgi:hypothetical protein